MSLCLFLRSSSMASKFRCLGDLRFKIHKTMPHIPLIAVMMAASTVCYLRDNCAIRSTIFCRVCSGSSPGITVATAMAAVSTAVTTPRYCCQWDATFVIKEVMSIPAGLCQSPILRLISSQPMEQTAPATRATSHSFVLMV